MILRILWYALGIYLLYKLIFDIIIPIFKVTRRVRQQFSDMQQQMHDRQTDAGNQGFPKQSPPGNNPPAENVKVGEYIDFEEVK